MRKGGYKKHVWQRPRFDQEGSIIRVKQSKPRNSARNGEPRAQPQCKSRVKSKGNRKAHDQDVGADTRVYNWAPFLGRKIDPRGGKISMRKVSLDVDRYNEDLGIALSLSLVENHKRRGGDEVVEKLLEESGGGNASLEYCGAAAEEEDQTLDGLPEIEDSSESDEEIQAAIDNLCGDLAGIEEVLSDGESDSGGWSWESFSSGGDDDDDSCEVEEDGYEIVDTIRDDGWAVVSVF